MNTKHFFIRYKTYLQEVPILLSLIVLASFLIKNINFFPIPNSDIFQYICDARDYYLGMLPTDIHAAPGYSLLIGFFAPFFPFLSHTELKTGILLNTGGIITSLYLIWKLALQRTSYFWATVLLLFLMTNPLVFITAVNTTPEPLMMASVLLSVYVWPKSKILGYFIAMLAFLVRYEALPVFIVFVFLHFLESRKKKERGKKDQGLLLSVRKLLLDAKIFMITNRVAVLSFLVIISWLFVVFSINGINKIPLRNTYLFEIFDRQEDIPELRFINHFYYIVTANIQSYYILYKAPLFVFVGNLLFLSLAIYFGFRSKWVVDKTLSVFILIYLLLHISFPAYNVRYFLPVLFVLLYLFLPFFKKSETVFGEKWVFRILIILLLVVSRFDAYTFDFQKFINADRYHFVEYKWAAKWFKEQEWEEKITVISDYTYIFSFYLDSNFHKPNFAETQRCILQPILKDNNNVFNIPSIGINRICDGLECLLDERGITEGRVFLNVTEYGETSIMDFVDRKECFKEAYKRIEPENQLIIYEYDFANCSNNYQE